MRFSKIPVSILVLLSLILTVACGQGAAGETVAPATRTPRPTLVRPTDTPVPAPASTPSVKLVVPDPQAQQPVALRSGQTLILALNATGENLTYDWLLDGEGHLEKNGEIRTDEGKSNRYTAPRVTGPEILQELVSVTVRDRHNASATDQIFIDVTADKVVEITPITESPGATQEPPVQNGGVDPGPTEGPTPEPCVVRITDPPSNGRVLKNAVVLGTVTPACEPGPSRWLVVEYDGRQWPQRMLIPTPGGPNGELTWAVNTNIGGDADAGKAFILKVIATNSQIDQEISDWFRRGEQTGDFPGFNPIDLIGKGAITVTGITVVRN